MGASSGISKDQKSPDEHKAELAQRLPAAQSLAFQHERLATMQDELLERSLSVVDASMRFAEIEPDTKEPPQEWIDELGGNVEKARRRLRVARAAWMSTSEAPVGIKVASAVAVGIIKAKATEKAQPRTLNIQVVQMTAPMPTFPEQDLEIG